MAKTVFGFLVALHYLAAQSQWAEVRLAVRDATGLALPSDVALVSQATRTERIGKTNDSGEFVFQHLPFGLYKLTVSHDGFATQAAVLDLHSTQPRNLRLQLEVKSATAEVVVTDTPTVLDPFRTGVGYTVGAQQIAEKQSSVPGRGLLELIDDQPGWLFEANGVLHPRGSEYDTLMVVDGVPMDENRSAAFAPGLQAAEVSALNVITGNIPAEYGRKLGGVIEITTSQDIRQGFHGRAEVGGGSFGTESGFFAGGYGWKRSAITLSASGDHADRYLDPPVLATTQIPAGRMVSRQSTISTRAILTAFTSLWTGGGVRFWYRMRTCSRMPASVKIATPSRIWAKWRGPTLFRRTCC